MSAVATERELIKLDIACGARKQPDHVGIDVSDTHGVDLVHDLFKFPWPVRSDSVSEAYCSHFVEHIPHRECLSWSPCSRTFEIPMRWERSQQRWGFVRDLWYDFWEEVHRVLVPGGAIRVATPYYSSHRADQDPTHERRICEESYGYLSQDWLRQNLCAYPFTADFEIESGVLLRSDPNEQLDHIRQINVVDDIAVVLRAKKPSKCWWEKPNA